MNSIFLGFTLALASLRNNRSKTLLTVFGITIGITLVVIVLSAGNGLKGIIMGQIAGFGDNWIDVEVKVPETGKNSNENANSQASGVVITTLTEQDMEAIRKVSNIKNAYASITSQATFSYGSEKLRPTIFGVTPSYVEIDKSTVEFGRFFTEEENKSASKVVVLGSEVAKILFPSSDPIGKLIKVDKSNFEVVGVMEELGNSGFMNKDMMAYMPVRTVQKKLLGVDHVQWIIAESKNPALIESTADEIRFIVRERHDITDINKDDFAVTTMDEAVQIVGTIVFGITALLIALSCISLLVGGVGIMNVMYVSVAERTFEIGLRKSAGATTSDILWQFLMEAVVLTLFGGVLGVAFGILFSFLIAVIAQAIGFDWKFQVSIFSLILSTGFSTLVGIIFGLYPAKKAASLDPMVAIRQE